jgi:hypothetical protein
MQDDLAVFASSSSVFLLFMKQETFLISVYSAFVKLTGFCGALCPTFARKFFAVAANCAARFSPP